MSKRLKIIRDYSNFKKGSEEVVADNVAEFMLMNGIASLTNKKDPCLDDPDCEDCEDCKGKKKKEGKNTY